VYKKLSLFLSICIIYLLLIYYQQTFILTEELYYNSFGNKLTEEQIRRLIGTVPKWDYLSYFLIPITILLRVSYTWICLKVGSFITQPLPISGLWKISMQAEIVFAVGAFIVLLYTEFFTSLETLEQLSLNPFSLQVLLPKSLPTWSNYFFNTINLFELGYVLFLAYLLASASKKTFISSLKFVASTYLPGLALWVLLVTYMSVVFQP
jgi:hypothetical protein